MTTGRINQIAITEQLCRCRRCPTKLRPPQAPERAGDRQSRCTANDGHSFFFQKTQKVRQTHGGRAQLKAGFKTRANACFWFQCTTRHRSPSHPTRPREGRGQDGSAYPQRSGQSHARQPTQRHTIHKKCKSTHDASHRHTAPTRTLDLPLADSTTRSEGGAIRDTWRPSHYLLSFDIAPTIRKCFLRHQQASQPLPPRGRGGRHLDRASALLPGSQA